MAAGTHKQGTRTVRKTKYCKAELIPSFISPGNGSQGKGKLPLKAVDKPFRNTRSKKADDSTRGGKVVEPGGRNLQLFTGDQDPPAGETRTCSHSGDEGLHSITKESDSAKPGKGPEESSPAGTISHEPLSPSPSQFYIPQELFQEEDWDGEVSPTGEVTSILIEGPQEQEQDRAPRSPEQHSEERVIMNSDSNITGGSVSASGEKEVSLTGKAPLPSVSHDKQDAIILSIATMREDLKKLQKLDSIEKMNIELQGEFAKVQSRITSISEVVSSVKSDMTKYEQKWDRTCKILNDRITSLEKRSRSYDNKLELTRTSVAKDLEMIQSGIDDNSKQVREMENFVRQSKDKWASLYTLEEKIKHAADKKFRVIQTTIKDDLRTEMHQAIKNEMKEEVIREIKGTEILQMVKEEIKEEMRKEIKETHAQQVSPADLERVKGEIREEVQIQSDKLSEESKHKSMKDQAFARRHNIVVFGISDNNSVETDTKLAHKFFKDRMGITGLNILHTYRLGLLNRSPNGNRPLVVKFANIQDKWLVWNNKSKIKYDQANPVRIQEDLPKKLREDNRVLQRIAKAANTTGIGVAKVKDYKVVINGRTFSSYNLKDLPPELQPQAVYTPRSHNAVVFFTKNSPLSNHFYAPFTLDGKRFVCIEQYLAYSKAMLSQNEALARRALEVNEAAEHKVILNTLRNEVQEKWEGKSSTNYTASGESKIPTK